MSLQQSLSELQSSFDAGHNEQVTKQLKALKVSFSFHASLKHADRADAGSCN
jgi:hypothetical protein